ncbi:MAG: GNAT family N-acetyltransferase [Eubacteriaceae bacterium]|nr:GNAT family N-acetyltransferase [Eubacteriaceae bacterium]
METADRQKLYIREFRPEDEAVILSWIGNDDEQRMWSADRYSTFPPMPGDMSALYRESVEAGGFFPYCLTDGERVLGHFILRYPTEDTSLLRVGFVIIDPSLRGQGIGKLLIEKAKEEAAGMGAKKLSLGVFTDNPAAYHCYLSCGFAVTGEEDYTVLGTLYPGYAMEMEI